MKKQGGPKANVLSSAEDLDKFIANADASVVGKDWIDSFWSDLPYQYYRILTSHTLAHLNFRSAGSHT